MFGSSLLGDLDNWELLTLADALQTVSYQDGTVVFRQGEKGDDFFIIVSVLDRQHPHLLCEYLSFLLYFREK